jgi:hypothetical protein
MSAAIKVDFTSLLEVNIVFIFRGWGGGIFQLSKV